MNFVNSKGSFVDKELEYLFAAYSVFEVRSVDWCDDGSRPSRVVLDAALDNRQEPEDLPLAPWY